LGSNNFPTDSGNVDYNKLKKINKLDYFENKNLKVKKIVYGDDFIIFLTGC
jgi:hypothetical protein